MITEDELELLNQLLDEQQAEKSKNNLLEFTKFTLPNFQKTEFHDHYYNILDKFAKKEIWRLIISVPPQHGKSQGSSRQLPAFLHGINPNCKIGLLSYSGPFSQKFNRDVKRILTSEQYRRTFPNTTINERATVTAQGWKNTQEEYEIIGYKGSLKCVGVGGALTGETVDVLIMDDLYKDYQDATSPTVSQRVWDWFLTVSKTRLHNDSQEIIVFTRWDENDVVGRLEKAGRVIDASECESLADAIQKAGKNKYIKINYEAIKSGAPNWLDSRQEGHPLYPQKHGIEKLEDLRELDPQKFSSLYQGKPRNKEGLMYSDFGTWSTLPELKKIGSYTDTADKGKDWLCTVFYGVPLDKQDPYIYVLDVVYTQKPMEETEKLVHEAIIRNDSRINIVESNNGGKGFARAIQNMLTSRHIIKWFTQTENKQARIFSNSASVNATLLMPQGWESRFPDFHQHISDHKKDGSSGQDDAADCITGVYETEKTKKKSIFV